MKHEFLRKLDALLAQLPEADRRRYVESYAELIDDKMEDGMGEAEAVAGLGDVYEIADEILRNTPLPVLVRTAVKPRRGWSAWSIVLTVLGSPVWLPLLIALGAVILSLYICLWSVVLSLFVTAATLGIGALAGLIAMFLTGSAGGILLYLGAALCLAGLGLLLGLASVEISRGLVRLMIWNVRKLKGLFIRKG